MFRSPGKYGEPIDPADVELRFLTVVNKSHDLNVEDSICTAVPDAHRPYFLRRADGLSLIQHLGCDSYKTSLPFQVSRLLVLQFLPSRIGSPAIGHGNPERGAGGNETSERSEPLPEACVPVNRLPAVMCDLARNEQCDDGSNRDCCRPEPVAASAEKPTDPMDPALVVVGGHSWSVLHSLRLENGCRAEPLEPVSGIFSGLSSGARRHRRGIRADRPACLHDYAMTKRAEYVLALYSGSLAEPGDRNPYAGRSLVLAKLWMRGYMRMLRVRIEAGPAMQMYL